MALLHKPPGDDECPCETCVGLMKVLNMAAGTVAMLKAYEEEQAKESRYEVGFADLNEAQLGVLLRKLIGMLSDETPKRTGIVLFLFHDKNIAYIANVPRPDAVKATSEWIKRVSREN